MDFVFGQVAAFLPHVAHGPEGTQQISSVAEAKEGAGTES